MPSLNLRLTAEQHDELRAAAYHSRTSIQVEMIRRLFPAKAEPKAKVELKSEGAPPPPKPRVEKDPAIER
jgi:hypothetical protein